MKFHRHAIAYGLAWTCAALLSGYVDNQTQIDQTLILVRGVEGVQSVANGMRIKK